MGSSLEMGEGSPTRGLRPRPAHQADPQETGHFLQNLSSGSVVLSHTTQGPALVGDSVLAWPCHSCREGRETPQSHSFLPTLAYALQGHVPGSTLSAFGVQSKKDRSDSQTSRRNVLNLFFFLFLSGISGIPVKWNLNRDAFFLGEKSHCFAQG